MSKRLTNMLKDELIVSLMEKFCNENDKKLNELKKVVTLAISDLVEYANENMFEDKRLQRILDSLPDTWIKKKNYFNVQIEGGLFTSIALNHSRSIFGETALFKIPYPFHGYNPAAIRVVEPNSQLVVKYNHYNDSLTCYSDTKKEYDKKYYELEANIRGALSKFRTTKQLEESWPEAYALLPKEDALPALEFKNLNSVLGIG